MMRGGEEEERCTTYTRGGGEVDKRWKRGGEKAAEMLPGQVSGS